MERIDFADLVAKNRRWTWVLLGASFLLLAVVSLTVSIYLGGGLVGVIAGVAVAMALTFASYAELRQDRAFGHTRPRGRSHSVRPVA